MDEQQENPMGRLILFGGLVTAAACFFLKLPNILLWGVVAPLVLISLGWFLGRRQSLPLAPLLLPLLLTVALIGVNGWQLVQQEGLLLPARGGSDLMLSGRYRHDFEDGHKELSGWRASSKYDGSDKLVSSRSVDISRLYAFTPDTDPASVGFSEAPDDFLGDLKVIINSKGQTLHFICNGFNSYWDRECLVKDTLLTAIAWAQAPYALGIVVTTPDGYSSHCLYKPNKHRKSVCNDVHLKNDQVILEAKREHDRPLGWQVSVKHGKFLSPVTRDGVEIVELDAEEEDKYPIKGLNIKVNYPDYILDFNCHLDSSSLFYKPALRCRVVDSRNEGNIKDARAELLDNHALHFTATVGNNMTSWCFFKTSEHDVSVCKDVHNASFGIDDSDVKTEEVAQEQDQSDVRDEEASHDSQSNSEQLQTEDVSASPSPEVSQTVSEPTSEIAETNDLSSDELEEIVGTSEESAVVLPDFGESVLHDVVLGHHDLRVSFLQYSPDGRILASASEDTTIKLWDPTEKQEVRTLRGHQKWVNSVVFRSNETLFSASDDKSVRGWDVTTGEEQYSFWGHESPVYSVGFVTWFEEPSYWNMSLFSTDSKGGIKFWNMGEEEVSREWQHINDSYVRAIPSPNISNILVGGGDGHLGTYRISNMYNQENTPQEEFIGHTDGVLLMAFSPDGEKIASVSRDSTVRVWDVSSQQEDWFAVAHEPRAITLAFHPSGEFLATGGDDSTIKIWDVTTGEHISTLSGHDERVLALAFSPDGRQLASGSFDTSIRLWQSSD